MKRKCHILLKYNLSMHSNHTMILLRFCYYFTCEEMLVLNARLYSYRRLNIHSTKVIFSKDDKSRNLRKGLGIFCGAECFIFRIFLYETQLGVYSNAISSQMLLAKC